MSVNRVLVVCLVFFVAAALSLAAIIVWRESLRGFTAKDRVITKYRPFFRTPTEQEEVVRVAETIKESERIIVNTTKTNETSSCFITCDNNNFYNNSNNANNPRQFNRQRRSTRSRQYQYHGCCKSYSLFLMPSSLPSISGRDVTIVQYEDLNQYFKTEVCEAEAGCNGCKCTQTYDLVNAVVYSEGNDDDEYRVTLVKIPGCCKCINI